MTLLVDTSVWSLALRRDTPSASPHVAELRRALASGETMVTTGLILQELLQGFVPEHARAQIIARFANVPLVMPDHDDHIAAAHLRTTCRMAGVQLGTIDALIAQLCIRHGYMLLSSDRDFEHAQPHIGIRLWSE